MLYKGAQVHLEITYSSGHYRAVLDEDSLVTELDGFMVLRKIT